MPGTLASLLIDEIDARHIDEASKHDIDAILKRCIKDPASPQFMAPPLKRPQRRGWFKREAEAQSVAREEVTTMRVGFIGLGRMGSGMAINLVQAGHAVTVYNRTRAKAEALAARGAKIADRPADACRGDVVFSMLADDAAVESVLYGEGASSLASGMAPFTFRRAQSALPCRSA